MSNTRELEKAWGKSAPTSHFCYIERSYNTVQNFLLKFVQCLRVVACFVGFYGAKYL